MWGRGQAPTVHLSRGRRGRGRCGGGGRHQRFTCRGRKEVEQAAGKVRVQETVTAVRAGGGKGAWVRWQASAVHLSRGRKGEGQGRGG